ncbi:hypothetical protein [uncultured Thomasclavelia sp.]|uniref:hypothetical protein n=1 Tax=uncultured Thomasclavelia sp. TaxID=3025759 RepID=UPI0025994AB2|nr:hypothetical protein [uncultured Thomasclavelia sp.]
MSKASDKLERELVLMVEKHIGESLPEYLPTWLIDEGVKPGSKIVGVDGIGSKDRRNKTDVIIYLENSEPIKISAKLQNADYFGNWYGHKRFLEEFNFNAFDRMTVATTKFANDWARDAVAPFVGVSICFGRRAGKTGQNFTDIFTPDDILTIARGYGNGDNVANCLFISDYVANNINGLINSIEELSIENVVRATTQFKVIYRPINPMTEGSNRGKNVYTRFQPYYKLPQKTIITSPSKLFSLGEFVTVEPDSLNHNHVLDDLEFNYNIVIPRKQK